MKNQRLTRLFAAISALALALCVTLPLSACGAPAASTDTPGSAAVADQGQITVNLRIDGSISEGGAQSDQVLTLPAGSTVLDALDTSNAQYTAEDSEYGPYVTIINGISAHDNYGWVYTVNDEEIMEGADAYKLSDGDTVTWTFVMYE
jgi:hypothetical protein